MNWYIVEFEDANTDKQLKFTSAADLAAHVRQYGDYILALDTKHRVPLSSMLLVGATGSGKSYGLYSLIIEAKSWDVKPHLYFCDPKNSSLVVLGNKIDLEHSGGTVNYPPRYSYWMNLRPLCLLCRRWTRPRETR